MKIGISGASGQLGRATIAELQARAPGVQIVGISRTPDEVKARVNRVVRRSVEHAFAHRSDSLAFVRAHAQEMSEEVMYKHIDLYVNQFSLDLGAEGRRAVELLFERGRATGAVPARDGALFLD